MPAIPLLPSYCLGTTPCILSAEGVQQDDPLDPILFCLALQPVLQMLQVEFKAFFLDNGSIGGEINTVANDLVLFEQEAIKLGLSLNHQKSELITVSKDDFDVISPFRDMQLVYPKDAVLLGSPIGDVSTIDGVIREKLETIQTIGQRLPYFAEHDALLLLKHALALPKVLFILRTSPCFLSSLLQEFDCQLHSILSSILHVDLSSDEAWPKASQPVCSRGIDVRSATLLVPSAFLCSAAGCNNLVKLLVPTYSLPQVLDLAMQDWSQGHNSSPPSGSDAKQQKAWDEPRVQSCMQTLLDSATDNRSCA